MDMDTSAPVTTNCTISDNWEDLKLDDENLEQEAKEMVTREFERIKAENDVAVNKAWRTFLRDLKSYSAKVYKPSNGVVVQPLNFGLDLIGNPKPADIISFKSQPAFPRMRYWVHTERNITCTDSVRLSHIPYVADDFDDTEFVRDLRVLYTEGIHGADRGIEQYMNDYMLYKLMTVTKQKWKHDIIYINTVIFKMFPNKYSLKILGDIYVTLKERFEPEFNVELKEDTHTIETLFCHFCMEFDCTTHSDGVATVNKVKKKKDKICQRLDKTEACSDECYVTRTNVENISMPEETMLCSTLDILIRSPDFDTCLVAKILNKYCEEQQIPTKTCAEWSAVIDKLVEIEALNASPVKNRKKPKPLSQREHYRKFKHLFKKMDNDATLIPCSHEGPCSAAHDCVCITENTACTKYCGCGETCKRRFSGCSCAPGLCYRNGCPCFLGRWECDPDTCKSCNCDVTIEKPGMSYCRNIGLQLGLKKDIIVKKSNVAGWGCFIRGPAEKGDLISEYCGEIITIDESERRGHIYDRLHCSYVFDLDRSRSIDAMRVGNVIRFANHADANSPLLNCESRVMMVNGQQRIGIFAKTKINDGDELFFDYRYGREQKRYVSLGANGVPSEPTRKRRQRKTTNES